MTHDDQDDRDDGMADTSHDAAPLEDSDSTESGLDESTVEEIELPPPAPSSEEVGPRGDEEARGDDDTATFDASELSVPPVPSTTRFGNPSDASDEQPVLVAEEAGPPSELQQAYECLEIRTPVQEFESYVRARLEAMIRLGRESEAQATSASLELGLDALRRAMGRRGKADA